MPPPPARCGIRDHCRVTTSIDWVSPAERANRSRRNPRRRGGHGDRTNARMRTVRETSAGGLVVDGLDGPRELQCAALIGRTDRRGRLLWSLPKGHIEAGETAEQTAIREVAEETGIRGSVLASLGSIDYWFVTEGRRVHKTVHHYLLRFQGGELSDEDVEVTEVAWVPLTELGSRLAYADERRLAEVAGELIDRMTSGQDIRRTPDGDRTRENG
ncbi:NUDIX hydrolase [Rhodococcus sp. NPDC054953]